MGAGTYSVQTRRKLSRIISAVKQRVTNHVTSVDSGTEKKSYPTQYMSWYLANVLAHTQKLACGSSSGYCNGMVI